MIKVLILLLLCLPCVAETGIASWYSIRCNHGTKTASGHKLNNNEFTCAHKKYRFGTRLKVTNLRNGKTIIVTVTDRGPFVRGRIIDVTPVAAKALGFYSNGLTKVKIEKL